MGLDWGNAHRGWQFTVVEFQFHGSWCIYFGAAHPLQNPTEKCRFLFQLPGGARVVHWVIGKWAGKRRRRGGSSPTGIGFYSATTSIGNKFWRRIVVSKNQKFDLISRLYLSSLYPQQSCPVCLSVLCSNGAFLCTSAGGGTDKEIVEELEKSMVRCCRPDYGYRVLPLLVS